MINIIIQTITKKPRDHNHYDKYSELNFFTALHIVFSTCFLEFGNVMKHSLQCLINYTQNYAHHSRKGSLKYLEDILPSCQVFHKLVLAS